MAYAEKLIRSWRACWYVPGRKSAVKRSGFPTKKAAEEYATEQEVDARRRHAPPDAHTLLMTTWCERWYSSLDLEPGTMRAYKSVLENHIIPTWGGRLVRDLAHADYEIAAWKKRLDKSYAPGTVNRITGALNTLLVDALAAGVIARNPAAAKPKRGRVAPKRQQRQEDRYDQIVDPLGVWLIAERCAALTGRPDEFVMMMVKYWLGLRWGEVVGLEKTCVTTSFQLTHQLYEAPGRKFYRKAPKDGSTRRLDVPPLLLEMMRYQADAVQHPKVKGKWCPCGEGLDDAYRHEPGVHLFTGMGGLPHLLGASYRPQVFAPAARGQYYEGQRQQYPVYLAQPDDWWDGGTDSEPLDVLSHVPTGKGVRAPKQPAACWAPISRGMKVHGLRHSAQALWEELGTPPGLVIDRMGHSPGRRPTDTYRHVTQPMRTDLVGKLQGELEKSLERRRAMGVESPVQVVRDLLESGDPFGRAHSKVTPDGKSRLQDVSRGRVA